MADTPTGFVHDPAVVPLKWPQELPPTGMTLHLQSNTSRFESPFTRTTQTQELPGGRFTLAATFQPLKDARLRVWRAFLARLRGSAGRFFFRAEIENGAIPDLGAAEPLVTKPLTADSTEILADSSWVRVDATVLQLPTAVAVAGSAGVTIEAVCTKTPGTVLLQLGRHISFDSPRGWRSLHLLVEDAVVRPGGFVSIRVEPPLPEPPAAGAPLHLRTPTGIFMLIDDDQGAVDIGLGRIAASPSIKAAQARPPRIVITP